MIELIFTVDYEIYGDGSGALQDLVYEPAERLRRIFKKANARLVNFVEVAELERIDEQGTDRALDRVKRQIREMQQEGFEIALHLHPQWYNATYERQKWVLDRSEYNLCTLPRPRVAEIVQRALTYMRHAVGSSEFTPLSFRAGNWLFQPTGTAASVLAEHEIRIDSSVFKGGLQHNYGLDYRPASKNGYYWRFSSDVNQADPNGSWLEIPIHAEMVPFWRMVSSKRISSGNAYGMAGQSKHGKVNRTLDFLRFRYPRKLDFCRMTLAEMVSSVKRVLHKDAQDPESYRPLVAIGHTKDVINDNELDAFLSFLNDNHIRISTFSDIYPKLSQRLDRQAVPCGS